MVGFEHAHPRTLFRRYTHNFTDNQNSNGQELRGPRLTLVGVDARSAEEIGIKALTSVKFPLQTKVIQDLCA